MIGQSLGALRLKNKFMKRTNKKLCPKCGSHNIVDTGSKSADVYDLGPNGKYQKPDPSIRMSRYKCNDCNIGFDLIETNN
ncbi:MAG: hypothetical protein AABX45_02265 [Nanoarchaeota archaeon]